MSRREIIESIEPEGVIVRREVDGFGDRDYQNTYAVKEVVEACANLISKDRRDQR